MDAIVAAGGRIDGRFADAAGARHKCLIRCDGETILRRTHRILRETGCVERIVVVGPADVVAEAADAGADEVIQEVGTGPANVMAALDFLTQYCEPDAHILVLAADLPILNAHAVREFMARSPAAADLCVPLVTRSRFEKAYPDTSSAYIRLREGEVTTGSAFIARAGVLLRNRAVMDRVFAGRKSQLRIAALAGPLTVARFLCGRLTAQHILGRVERILTCTCAAVRDCPPEIAFDLDDENDYSYFLQLTSRSASSAAEESTLTEYRA